jgi:polyisoprenoid-binding protein YceI
MDQDDPAASSVEVTIEAASIDTGAPDRDQHLRSADFLHVEHHPTIAFRSREVRGAADRVDDDFDVEGDLTIRGETIPVTLDARYLGRGMDPWGNQRAGFTAHVEIDRRDWGLRWNQALETGGLLVSNEVRIVLDVQALEQQGGPA